MKYALTHFHPVTCPLVNSSIPCRTPPFAAIFHVVSALFCRGRRASERRSHTGAHNDDYVRCDDSRVAPLSVDQQDVALGCEKLAFHHPQLLNPAALLSLRWFLSSSIITNPLFVRGYCTVRHHHPIEQASQYPPSPVKPSVLRPRLRRPCSKSLSQRSTVYQPIACLTRYFPIQPACTQLTLLPCSLIPAAQSTETRRLPSAPSEGGPGGGARSQPEARTQWVTRNAVQRPRSATRTPTPRSILLVPRQAALLETPATTLQGYRSRAGRRTTATWAAPIE